MTISDQSRHLLHQRLDEVLGPEDAATLMEHLPPVGWADVATRRDLDHARTLLGSELRLELAGLRTELKSEMGELRAELKSEMGELRAELKSEVGELRAELKSEMGELRTDLQREIGGLRGDAARQMQTLFLGLVGLQVSAAGLTLAVSRLL